MIILIKNEETNLNRMKIHWKTIAKTQKKSLLKLLSFTTELKRHEIKVIEVVL